MSEETVGTTSTDHPAPGADAPAAADPHSGAYRSPILESQPGAADAPEGQPQHGVAWHYGNPLVEQRAFERSAGVVDRSDRRVLRVAGPDALTWLNSLISQKIDALADGERTDGLILDAQGHVLHAFTIARADTITTQDTASAHDAAASADAPSNAAAAAPTSTADTADTAATPDAPAVYLISEPTSFPALQDYLTKMVFWSQVTIAEAELALLTLQGPDATRILGLNQVPAKRVLLPDAADIPPAPSGTLLLTDSAPAERIDLLIPRSELPEAFDALVSAGAEPTGLMAFEAERVMAGLPEIGIDTDERTVPHEIPAYIGETGAAPTRLAVAAEGPSDSYVHLNKGCYRGQETVSRIQNLGRPPRTLVVLQIDGSAATRPEPGDDVTIAGTRRRVGRIGTVAYHCDDGPVGLALVKHNALDKQLEAGGAAVAVDPASIRSDDTPRAGRRAVENLKRNS